MPRFKKPESSKRTVPFQREVPPPSPSAGTPTGVDPWSVRQTLGPARLGNVEGGWGTVVDYAKGLENVSSKGLPPKDRRAILEKLVIGSPEQAKALADASQPYRSGNQYLMPKGLAPLADTVAFGRRGLDALSSTNLSELLGLGGAARTVQGKGSIVDAAALPLNWFGTLQAAGALGKLPKGTIPKALQAGGMYGAGSIDPKTRKMLQKYIGGPVSKGWDFLNTPIADLLP
jgi:hypothetical protein